MQMTTNLKFTIWDMIADGSKIDPQVNMQNYKKTITHGPV